ncbi:MAG: DUF4333 domain-containing protein [Acidimicrobiales bacterium]|nr:DUF4333 domain-containing protein [Acidimicrobiales bacterium]MCB9373411.1 DUF4333 domain-containing protein [Microthrixaceae bacterium]
MRTFRALSLVGVLAAGAALLVGCSEDSVPQADVEAEAETQLAAEVGGTGLDVSCPGDLKAEVDETMECDLTVDGDDNTYPVTLTVTAVDGNQANFDIEVGDPSGG